MSLVLASWLAVAASLARAAPGDASGTVTERVEVVATAPEEAAAFVTTIDGDELAGRAVDLADVLRHVPGARVRDWGGLGSPATVSLRASTAEQVTVLVDGVPQNRALGGAVDLSSIPASRLAEIHVWRGFAPAAWGLGGIGGVVDVRTHAPTGRPRVDVDLLAGELGTSRLSSGASFPLGESTALQADAEWLASDGDFAFRDTRGTPFSSDDVVRRRTNNDLDQRSSRLGFRARALGGTLRAGLHLTRRERGFPGVDALPAEGVRLDERRQELTVGWSLERTGGLDALDLAADLTHERHDLGDLAGELGRPSARTTRIDAAGVAATARGSSGSWNVLGRIDLRGERARLADGSLADPDQGGAERALVALTTEALRSWGPLVLAPALRLEHVRDDLTTAEGGLDTRVVQRRGVSGKLGLALPLGPRLALRGSIGTNHRNPSLVELFGDRGAVRGNPGLRSEESIGAELGASWSELRAGSIAADVELVGFVRRTDDLIWFRPTSPGVAVATNVARAEVAGVELALGARLGTAWHARGALTLQDARDASGAPWDGEPLPYQPRVLGAGGVSWSRGGTSVRWDASYVGPNSDFVYDDPWSRLPERWLHDLTVTVERPGGLVLGIDVRNALDREVRDLARYPLPGRVLHARLGWSLR